LGDQIHWFLCGPFDAAYILDTFPIVREQDQAAFGRYRTKDDALAQLRAVTGGALRVAPAA
jgi:hypothetical protein